ncbi:unnamed protein product, partial [Rotaria sp. Silwood1]
MHLVVYNYGIIKNKIIVTNLQRAQDNVITQLCYNHNANFIAVASFHYAKTAILFIEFSKKSTYLATA